MAPRRSKTAADSLSGKSIAWAVGIIVILAAVFIAADLLLPASPAKRYWHDKDGYLVKRATSVGCAIKYRRDQITEKSYHCIGAITETDSFVMPATTQSTPHVARLKTKSPDFTPRLRRGYGTNRGTKN